MPSTNLSASCWKSLKSTYTTPSAVASKMAVDGLLNRGRHPRDDREEEPAVGHPEEDPGTGHHRAVDAAEGRHHHHRRDDAPRPLLPANGIRSAAVAAISAETGHFGKRHQVDVREVDRQVDDDDGQGAEDEGPGKVSRRILDFPADVGQVGPAVVGPHDGDERRAHHGQPDAVLPRRREVGGAPLADQEGQHHQGNQRPVLHHGGQVDQHRGHLDAEVVEEPDEDDRAGRHILDLGRRERHEVPEVLGEDRRDGPQRGGTDHRQLPTSRRGRPAAGPNASRM